MHDVFDVMSEGDRALKEFLNSQGDENLMSTDFDEPPPGILPPVSFASNVHELMWYF